MNIETRLQQLKNDLLAPDGPAISTNRSYPFAIYQYDPGEEYGMRRRIGELVELLRSAGWSVRNVDLFATLVEFLEKQEDGQLIPAWIEEEQRQFAWHKNQYDKPLAFLESSLNEVFKDQDAFPRQVLDQVTAVAESGIENKTVVFLSRIGALYPVFKTSALLKYLDTGIRVPTIALYPGTRVEQHYLSFMGEIAPDRDYRPRIY